MKVKKTTYVIWGYIAAFLLLSFFSSLICCVPK